MVCRNSLYPLIYPSALTQRWLRVHGAPRKGGKKEAILTFFLPSSIILGPTHNQIKTETKTSKPPASQHPRRRRPLPISSSKTLSQNSFDRPSPKALQEELPPPPPLLFPFVATLAHPYTQPGLNRFSHPSILFTYPSHPPSRLPKSPLPDRESNTSSPGTASRISSRAACSAQTRSKRMKARLKPASTWGTRPKMSRPTRCE